MQDVQSVVDFTNVPRNSLCPCGSNVKFKKCHALTPVVPQEIAPVEEKEVDVTKLNPAAMAQVLKERIDKFALLVHEYPGDKKQLKRVLTALAVHPFNERPFYSVHKHESDLFNLGVLINSDKLLFLHLSFEEQRMVEEMKAKALAKQTETQETENGKES